MSTKEEHLADLVSANIEKSGAVARTTFGWLQQLAEARAERDAAEEDSRLTLEEHLRVVRQRDDAHDELEQARNRIEFLENGAAPVPSPAPVVGGVTEAMLDTLERVTQAEVKSRAVIRVAFDDARAAIRAQKRVDVEAIRNVALQYPPDGHIRPTLLRAIGDEPAEAPVAEPAPVMRLWQHDETGRCVEAFVQPGPRYVAVATPMPKAEPAAPAQEGPYDARGLNLWENGKVIAWCNAFADLNKIVRLLNLGVEAEKLRARVAELEYEQQRVSKAVAGGLRDETMMVGSLVWDVVGLKARADAAQADMKALREALDATRNALGISAFSAPEMMAYHASAVVARADAAEAKLAALGENPIPRALVTRHLDASEYESVDLTLNAILAGREPGVAS